MRTPIAFATLLSVSIIPLTFANDAPTPEQLADSWTKNCAKCHGADGAGKTKAGRKLRVRDYTSAAVQAEITDAEMIAAIKDGVKKNGEEVMEGYASTLSPAEIDAMVALIRSMAK